jgi:hypothetical protein
MIDDATLKATEQIRLTMNAEVDRLRNDPSLSTEARQARMARAYVEAKTAMDKLRSGLVDDAEARIRVLTAKVWGLDDVAGQNGSDRASASVSYRDAQDRVAALETLDQARELLARAEATGDELLARALAARASDPMWSWDEILDAYFELRPDKVAAFVELRDLSRPTLQSADLFGYYVSVPSELANMPDYRVQALASDPRFVGA